MRKSSLTANQIEQIRYLYEQTEKTLEDIAAEANTTWKPVWRYIQNAYSKTQRDQRKSRTYANSKTGDKNPQYGKSGEDTAHWKGGNPVADGKGYLIVPKPDWYTGRAGSKYVFQHTIIMCEALHLVGLPAGFVVHHIDGNKTNNVLSNLALMTIEAHARLHSLERVTTSRKA